MVKDLAAEYGVCTRPVTLRRIDYGRTSAVVIHPNQWATMLAGTVASESARSSAAVSSVMEAPMSNSKRPIDPAPLYPDVIALGSLGAAVRVAAVEQKLSLPVEAFLPIGEDPRANSLYGLTVQSGHQRRDILRITASWLKRSWTIEGCESSQRIDGVATDLAELARVAVAWRDRTPLADIHKVASSVALHDVDYRYFGVIRERDTDGEPSTVLRVWTDADGRQQEETYTRSLSWERTDRMSFNARPTYDPDPVEIDTATVERFVSRVRVHILESLRRE